MPKTYPVRKSPDGLIIEGVEVFQLGEHRGFNYDRAWFDRLKTNHDAFDAIGFNPPVIVGHNTDPAKEKAKIAGFSNISLADDGKTVRADYLLLETDGTPETLKLFSKFPQRSVEVLNNKACFTAIAQLGGTEPHFKFPDLNPQMFSAVEEDPVIVQFAEEEMSLEQVVEEIKSEQKLSDLEWAFYRKLSAIKDNSELSIEEKRAALAELVEEWAGLATEILADSAEQMAALQNSEPFKALEAELQKFRDRDRQNRLNALRDAGISPVFVNRFEALLKAVPAQSPEKVRFSANRGQPEVESSLHDFLLDTLDKMASAAQVGTLFAAVKPAPLPIQNDALPKFRDSVEPAPGTPANFSAAERIKQYLREQGLHSWTHTQYAEAKRELLSRGEIEVE